MRGGVGGGGGWGAGLMYVCVGGVENLPVISQNKDCEEINLCENSEGLEPPYLIRVFAIRLVIARIFLPNAKSLIRML